MERPRKGWNESPFSLSMARAEGVAKDTFKNEVEIIKIIDKKEIINAIKVTQSKVETG